MNEEPCGIYLKFDETCGPCPCLDDELVRCMRCSACGHYKGRKCVIEKKKATSCKQSLCNHFRHEWRETTTNKQWSEVVESIHNGEIICSHLSIEGGIPYCDANIVHRYVIGRIDERD